MDAIQLPTPIGADTDVHPHSLTLKTDEAIRLWIIPVDDYPRLMNFISMSVDTAGISSGFATGATCDV